MRAVAVALMTLVALASAPGCRPCGAADLPAPIKACLASSSIPVDGLDLQVSLDVSGTVVAAGVDNVPNDCFRQTSFVGGTGAPDDSSDGSWFTFDDGSETKTVAVRAAGASLGAAPGDHVHVVYRISGGGFSTLAGDLLVEREDAFEVYAGSGNDIPDLALPLGIALARGNSVCDQQSECLSASRFDLVATRDGESVTIAHGTEAAVGDVLVRHGGYLHQTSGTSCPDAFAADLHVLIRPKR